MQRARRLRRTTQQQLDTILRPVVLSDEQRYDDAVDRSDFFEGSLEVKPLINRLHQQRSPTAAASLQQRKQALKRGEVSVCVCVFASHFIIKFKQQCPCKIKAGPCHRATCFRKSWKSWPKITSCLIIGKRRPKCSCGPRRTESFYRRTRAKSVIFARNLTLNRARPSSDVFDEL